jgi:hypothetical protein
MEPREGRSPAALPLRSRQSLLLTFAFEANCTIIEALDEGMVVFGTVM